jgi:hypothetical protein
MASPPNLTGFGTATTVPGTDTFGLGTLGADAKISSGATPAAITDAQAFAQQIASANIYVTGHSLGGTEGCLDRAGIHPHGDLRVGSAGDRPTRCRQRDRSCSRLGHPVDKFGDAGSKTMPQCKEQPPAALGARHVLDDLANP